MKRDPSRLTGGSDLPRATPGQPAAGSATLTVGQPTCWAGALGKETRSENTPPVDVNLCFPYFQFLVT